MTQEALDLDVIEARALTDEMFRAYKGAIHRLIGSVPTIGERAKRWRQSSPNGYRIKEREKATARYFDVRAVDPEYLALVARIRELEAGLRPFAQAADLYFENDEHLIISGTEMSIGDLRQAARLLTSGSAAALSDTPSHRGRNAEGR